MADHVRGIDQAPTYNSNLPTPTPIDPFGKHGNPITNNFLYHLLLPAFIEFLLYRSCRHVSSDSYHWIIQMMKSCVYDEPFFI
jgi:hypothetical protein